MKTKFKLALVALSLWAGSASADVIDFESLSAGDIVDSQLSGVTIYGHNFDHTGAGNLAVIFDTDAPTGGDGDLGAPFTPGHFEPGNVLIIHENPWTCSNGVCNNPDDEGSRPAGWVDITFDTAVTLQSIDFFDIEQAENGQTPQNAILLFDENGLDLGGGFFTPNTGGDNTWGQVNFGDFADVTRIRVHFGGSGALDNIVYSVPAPASLLLILAGLMGLLRVRNI